MSSLSEALTKVVTTPDFKDKVRKAHSHPEAFILTPDNEIELNSIQVSAIKPDEIQRRFQDLETFFLEVRRKVRELSNDIGWNIRYASQVKNYNLPFLHNNELKAIYIDPMLPYRDPIQSLGQGESFTLYRMPSQVYYAKPKAEALNTAAVNGNHPRLSRIRTKETGNGTDKTV